MSQSEDIKADGQAAAAIKNSRLVTGRVVSDKMDKSIVVLIERKVQHPLYSKYMRRTSKVVAHDENNECSTGALVEIVEGRPISKRKSWRLVRVVEAAGEFANTSAEA